MKTTIFFAVVITLLSGCDRGPNREEIEALCKDIGQKAYWDAPTDTPSFLDVAKAAAKGAIAECKLKYLTGK